MAAGLSVFRRHRSNVWVCIGMAPRAMRIILSAVIVFSTSICSFAADTEYPRAFDRAFDRAERYVSEHRFSWDGIWRRYDVPCDIAEAVIFPEVIRFGLIQDKMETAAVRSTYVSKGTEGFDFSIGRFQMKPSFIEDLEQRWMRSGLAAEYGLSFDVDDSPESRRSRITRMYKEEWQCVYVAVFLKLFYQDFGSYDRNGDYTRAGVETIPSREQVRLAATAYNHGCPWKSPGHGDIPLLRALSEEKHYHTDFTVRSKTYMYAYGDIALRHWDNIHSSGAR